MTTLAEPDRRWLDSAARLATPFLGTSGAGPTVGALIVDEQRRLVFARAVTPAGGQTSAEAAALAEVRELAKGRTLYVTMEPATRSGTGRPPVAALIAAGIGRVVIGALDPDPKLAGAGRRALEAAGIAVTHAPHDASRLLNEGYAMRVTRQRPHVTVKLALTADEMVGHAKAGLAPPIGEAARRWVERLRAGSDAVLSGAARAGIENNDMTVRLKGLTGRSHLRLLLAGTAPLDTTTDLFTGVSGYPTAIVVAKGRTLALRPGIEVIPVDDRRGRPDLRQLLAALGARGINRLLVEAGAKLAESFIGGELVDRLHVIDAGVTIGRGGTPAVLLGRFAARMEAARLVEVDRRVLGEDKVRTFHRA